MELVEPDRLARSSTGCDKGRVRHVMFALDLSIEGCRQVTRRPSKKSRRTRLWNEMRHSRASLRREVRRLSASRRLHHDKRQYYESLAAPRGGQCSPAPRRCVRTLTSAQSAPACAHRTPSPHLPALGEDPRVPTTVTPRGVLLAQVSRGVHGATRRPLHDPALTSPAHLLLGGAELPRRQQQPLAEVWSGR